MGFSSVRKSILGKPLTSTSVPQIQQGTCGQKPPQYGGTKPLAGCRTSPVGKRLAINIFLSSGVELVQRIVTASPSHPCGMGLDFLTYRGQSCLKGSEFV